MFSSGTTRLSLKSEVVGANDPIPSVSKKFVPKPTAFSKKLGGPLQPLPVRPARVAAAAARYQAKRRQAVRSARAVKRKTRGSRESGTFCEVSLCWRAARVASHLVRPAAGKAVG